MTIERFGGLDLNQEEGEKSPKGKGVVLLIVDAGSLRDGNPRLYTVNELFTSSQTDKLAGQVSFPAETKKAGEKEAETVFGGLAEFTDSETIVRYLRINPERFYAKSAIRVNDYMIDLAVILYDGPTDVMINPTDRHEVEPNGWMEVSKLRLLNGEARSIVGNSIDFALRHGIFENYLENKDSTVPLTGLIEGYSSFEEVLRKRGGDDIILH